VSALRARAEEYLAMRGPDRLLPVPGRHPLGRAWSRKHTDTQRRLCQRYLAPVIGHLACEDIKTGR